MTTHPAEPATPRDRAVVSSRLPDRVGPAPGAGERPGGSRPPPDLRSVLGFLTANVGLAGAVLFYMGWAYTSAWLGHFSVNPLNLDISVTEYALRGLSLFSPEIVVMGVVTVLVITLLRSAPAGDPAGEATSAPSSVLVKAIAGWAGANHRRLVRRLGLGAGLAGVVGYLLPNAIAVPTYLLLALLGAGPLLAAGARRGQGPAGRYAYAVAVVVAALCGLWAAGLYASARGVQAGRNTARDLQGRTAAVVYSTDRLALAGPGVRTEPLPKDGRYRYRYTGLRLLITRADRYYLLPAGWAGKADATYVLKDGDDLRVELYAGTR